MLGRWAVLERLADANHVLLAGAGGGYDVYGAVPLMVALEALGKTVSLANLSFTRTEDVEARRVTPWLLEVRATTPGPDAYFPERALARWLVKTRRARPVWTFAKTGVVPLAEAYAALQHELGFDALVLVDGGTDILMTGDEAGLGTPVEDLTSVAAAHALAGVATKLVVCIGFGVDHYHGVCHAHFLENVAALARDGAFLGVTSILPGTPSASAYLDAVEHALRQLPAAPSIVNLSVASAIEGAYGDVHRTRRTQGSTLWINPLMALYWGFELDAVARRCKYLDRIRDTCEVREVTLHIEAFREDVTARLWQRIPV